MAKASETVDKSAQVAWTWVSGASTFSGPFGHLTGIVRDRGDGTADLGLLLVRPGGTRSVHVVHTGYRVDDHDAPGVVHLGGADFIVGATGHGDDAVLHFVRLRVDETGITEILRSETVLPEPSTYVHLLRVGDARGHLLVLTRSLNWNPTGLWLDVDTLATTAPFRAVPWSPGDGVRGRPYWVCRQLADSALIALVEDHPLACRNGVVVAEIAGGVWCRMDGSPIRAVDDLREWHPFDELERVLDAGGEWVPWVHDVQRDQSGRTAVAWSERDRSEAAPDDVAGLRYRIATHVPAEDAWRIDPPVYAGSALYRGEADYAGGIAFAADSIERVTFVSDVDPLTGEVPPSRSRRLYELRRGDGSRFLRRLDAHAHPLRPRVSVPLDPQGEHATWWLAGDYRAYRDFDTRAELRVYTPGVSCFRSPTRHVDLPFAVGGGMSPGIRRAVASYLDGATGVVEFGAGSSTLLAFDSGVERITSVDADRDLLTALEMVADERGLADRYEARAVDVGQIGEAGYPIGHSDLEAVGRRYAAAGLVEPRPDVVVIGGRFRAACFLQIVRTARGPVTVLWDDYAARAHYRMVEQVLVPSRLVEGLAVFTVPGPVAADTSLIEATYRDPR